MRLRCLLDHEELGGNLTVGPAPPDQAKDLDLTFRQGGETVERVAVGIGLSGREVVRDEPLCDLRREQGSTNCDKADGVQQLGGGRMLEQEAAGAGAQRGVDVF